jgi:hypothetical protein
MVISGVGVVSTVGEGTVLGVEVGAACEAQLQLTMELTTPVPVSFRNSRREIDGMVSSSRIKWVYSYTTDINKTHPVSCKSRAAICIVGRVSVLLTLRPMVSQFQMRVYS